MKNYNKKQLEDLLIEIINENVEQPNLNYSSLRAKIKIETKETKRPKLFATYKSKLIFTCSLALIMIISIIGITTINKYSIFYQDTSLSNTLLNENALLDNRNNSYEGISIYNLLLNKDESSSYLVEAHLTNNESDYYCAYLSKSIINKVNSYFDKNNIEKNIDYIEYKKHTDYYGINDIFLKYSYYQKMKNITTDNIKWVKYSKKDEVKDVVGKYHLSLIIKIQNFKNVLDLTTKQNLSSLITVITEIDLSKEEALLEKGRYLINVKEKLTNDLNISSSYLSWNSALIKTFDNKDYLEGIIPLWYNIYLENEEEFGNNLEHVKELKDVLDLIEPYKSFEINIRDEVKNIYKYYYDYVSMQNFFGF